MNRIEKIAFLSRLQAGKATISELTPKALKQRIGYGENEKYSIEGNYVDQETFSFELKNQIKQFGHIGRLQTSILIDGCEI